jgi:hypothetical protein
MSGRAVSRDLERVSCYKQIPPPRIDLCWHSWYIWEENKETMVCCCCLGVTFLEDEKIIVMCDMFHPFWINDPTKVNSTKKIKYFLKTLKPDQ